MRRLSKFVSVGLSVLLLTGCGSSDEINTLNNMSALNSDSSVTASYDLSWTDKQEMVYAQVSSRQLLDLSTLDACTDNEIQQVRNYMDSVDAQLIGDLDVVSYDSLITKYLSSDLVEDDAVLDTALTDYLLSFFERTPYYWQRTKTTIRGIDPSSRSIIVDVAYKTIDYNKEVVDDSYIPLGIPNYDTLCKNRLTRWLNILNLRLNNPMDDALPSMESEFVENYGDPEDIIESQRNYSPTQQIYLSGNQKTYNGLIDYPAEQSGGTCTVRYILVPNYVMGINLGMTCEHMYITDYRLNDDPTAGLETFTEEGYATVTDSVYNLIYSYFTCMDESDYDGLYKLSTNFENIDKFYQDTFESTYQKHDGFSVSLFDVKGTTITCGITISTKERAKESNMMFPIYTDKYFAQLELVNDMLKIDNLTLLSRTIEGEPTITTEDADLTGFSASIDLDNDDKLAIEKLICDLSLCQIRGVYTADSFRSLVDTSLSDNQTNSIKENLSQLTGSKQKVVFLGNYQQGTSNYASVRCKELYQDESNAITEVDATYEFIHVGEGWKVYNYDMNMMVKLDTTNLSTTNCLCLVDTEKVVSYTSQVRGTITTSLDEVSDTSVSFDHEEYEPKIKEGVEEQGLSMYRVDQMTGELFDATVANIGMSFSTFEEYKLHAQQIEDMIASFDTMEFENPDAVMEPIESYSQTMLDMLTIIASDNDNRIDDTIKSDLFAESEETVQALSSQLNTLLSEPALRESEYYSLLQEMGSNMSALGGKFRI